MDSYLNSGRDYRQAEEYNRYFLRRGWRSEYIGETVLLVKWVPVIGTMLIMKRGSPDTRPELVETLAGTVRARLIKLDYDLPATDPKAPELIGTLKAAGYSQSRLPFCPTKTLRLDLKLSLEELLSRAASDVPRYLRQNGRESFVMRRNQTVDSFYPLLRQASRKNRYLIPKLTDLKEQWESFGPKLNVVLAYKDDRPLGGAMVVCNGERASGIFMAVTDEGLSCHLPYSLMWETILVTKEAGARIFDLDGIYDERYHAPNAWKGLSVFKKKFGGEAVEMLGSYIKGDMLPISVLATLGLI